MIEMSSERNLSENKSKLERYSNYLPIVISGIAGLVTGSVSLAAYVTFADIYYGTDHSEIFNQCLSQASVGAVGLASCMLPAGIISEVVRAKKAKTTLDYQI